MRRTLLMIAAVALLLTQCRKPAVELPTAGPANENMVSMTVTVGHGRTLIGADGTIKWSAGDKLYVGDGSKYIGCLTLQGTGGSATGTFSGTVSATESTDFGLYYLGSGDYTSSLESGATSVDISFASQTGLIGDLSTCHIGYGTATGEVKDGNVILNSTDPVTMTSKVAIAYFEFKDGTAEGYTGAITLSGANICNEMTVKFSGAESGMFTGKEGTARKAISLVGGHAQRYVMLVPTGTGEETLEFGGAYEGTTKLYKGIEANKFYCVGEGEPIEVTVTKFYETVNFGAPNLNWSKYNLGVDPAKLTSAWDWYGDYYAWGEVVPYYTSLTWNSATACTVNGWNTEATLGGGGIVNASKGYAWESYSHGSSSFIEWNELPCTGSVPYDSDNKLLLPERDAATAAWGEGWRMPTSAEWKLLYDNNKFKWLGAGDTDSETGFKAVTAGYLVVKGGKHGIAVDAKVYMFLPAAGYGEGKSICNAGSYGRYWSSSRYTDKPEWSERCSYVSGNVAPQSAGGRYNGMVVRPVRPAH